MIDTSFLSQLKRFSLIIDRKVNSNYQGERKSFAAGSGLLLKDYVQYTPGDDFRKIDWRVFARTDKLFIRRYEEERNLTIHVLLDYSGSMNYGGKYKKSDYAAMLGIGFAYMAMGNNERFVMATFAEKLERYRPRRGRKQLAAMVEYLNNKKAEGRTNFESSLATYHKRQISSKSMVFIISDFLYDVDEIRRALLRYKNHKVVLIQVLDPTEMSLDLEGDYRLIDSETKDSVRTHISPNVKTQYKEALAGHSAKIKNVADELKAQYFQVSSGDLIFDSFYKILG
ncbi:MAG: DUF58 domain-containing protein [Candidatus Nanoarchaeia archaeon]